MRHVIGAVAAAMLFAAGCAHQRETTARADTSTASQASVDAKMRGQAVAVPGMDCEVVSPAASASTRSQSSQRELQVGDVSNPQFEAPDTEVSGTAQNESLGLETQAPPPAVASPAPAAPPPPPAPEAPEAPEAPPAVASPAPAVPPPPPAPEAPEAPEAPAVASPAPAQEAPEVAPAPDVANEEDTATGGAASEGAFEGPDMGGASGGGG